MSRTGPPTICLNMIVRNEAHVIVSTLESVSPHIAYWVIVDTGSTDHTREIVRDYFAARGIPGELHDRPWKNFGENRTEALALAFGKADYLWVIDADDLVVGTLDLTNLTLDSYQLRIGRDPVYWRRQLFRGTLRWAYRGVLHEYPVSLESSASEGRLAGDYYIDSRRLGDRNRAPDKNDKDCKLLLEALAENPDDARATFYLAQTYFDAGNPREALRYYRQRAAMGGWNEEVFYALYRAAASLALLGEPWAVCQDAYLTAFQHRPSRAEPLHAIARHHRIANNFDVGYLFARAADEIPFPDADALFVARDVHTWRSADERAICAYYIGRSRESFDLCTRILNSPDLPEDQRDRVTRNRDFCVPDLKNETLAYPDAVVRRITGRARNPETPASVTCTITTCKRLDLFEQTMNSFLNCCEDVEEIDRWILVDDGSSERDRQRMQERYPFFECIWKTPDDRGHARSMNRLLDLIDSPYWLHLEDDWHFFVRDRYVGKSRAILEDDLRLGQVLFNRNYGETLDCRDVVGGFVARTREGGVRYRVHEHIPADTPEYKEVFGRLAPGQKSMLYWPHYSLRPSLLRMSAIRDVGVFLTGTGHFEYDFAVRYRDRGYLSASFDTINALHTGKLTNEHGPGARPNAYDLNNEPQFSKRAVTRKTRVRLLAPADSTWASDLMRQARDAGAWDDIVLTTDDDAADYSAIIDEPETSDFNPGRSIVFLTEPDSSAPDARGFVQVRSLDRYPSVGTWSLDRTWEQLAARSIEKTHVLTSTIAGNLVRHLEERGISVSVSTPGDATALLASKYVIAAERVAERNYVTSAFFDALVAECLCFYWGCPNLEDRVDAAAFIRLPIDDVEASAKVIEAAIRDDEWSRRIDAIRRAKLRFLNESQFVPTLARVVHGHALAQALNVRVLNLDRRPDRWESFRRAAQRTAGVFVARCERVSAVDGRTLTLTPEIRHRFRGNDFNYRRGIVGCALSHLAIWQSVAADNTTCLVLEDDARLGADFQGQLTEVCGYLRDVHADADVTLLGQQTWTHEQARELLRTQSVAVRPMQWDQYLGGTHAYVISPAGATKLLAIADRDGIQNGIDWFLMHHGAELNVLQAVPPLVSTPPAPPGGAVDSDIQHDMESVADTAIVSARAHRDRWRVKMICNWCSPRALCDDWNRMSQGAYRWNDLEITWEDRDVDFYAIINKPSGSEYFDPARSIVFQMEPWCALPQQTWGVKTWGEWATPDPSTFLQVRAHTTHLNNAFWQFRSTYQELKTRPIVKSKGLSTICSDKYFDPGHIKRVDFLKYLEGRRDPAVGIDIFAYENRLGFTSYAGPHEPGTKESAMFPYRYQFLAENNQERNYITEKLWEPLLAESLCFYAGCPNAADYVDPRAFIALDLDDFDGSFEIIKRAMRDGEWEKRIDVIRREKLKVLDEYQFFPTLERVLLREMKMPFAPTDDEVTYHKYFHALAGVPLERVAVVHTATLRGDTSVAREIIETIASSTLAERLDCLVIVNVGDDLTWDDLAGGIGARLDRVRVQIVNYSADVRQYERPALNLLRVLARAHPSSKLLYLHTKGVSHQSPRLEVDDWRRYMLYFLVEHHDACLEALDSHDAAGCNLRDAPRRHFSGNFWWTNAEYVSRLPPVTAGDRHACEWWILSAPDVRPASMWESNVDHYRQRYPRESYARFSPSVSGPG